MKARMSAFEGREDVLLACFFKIAVLRQNGAIERNVVFRTRLRQLFGGRDFGSLFRRLLARLGGFLTRIRCLGGFLLAALRRFR